MKAWLESTSFWKRAVSVYIHYAVVNLVLTVLVYAGVGFIVWQLS